MTVGKQEAGRRLSALAARNPHLQLPADGQPPAMYRPDRCTQDLLRAALQVDVGSLDSLGDFVNAWGRLGVGLGLAREAERLLSGPGGEPAFDSVWATQRALASIQEHFHWLAALKRGQWSATGVPRAPDDDRLLDAAHMLMAEPDWLAMLPELEHEHSSARLNLGVIGTSDPYVSSFSRRRRILQVAHRPPADRGSHSKISTAELHWRAFAVSLEPHLRRIDPTIRWEPKVGPVPAWRVRAPIDVLWAALWGHATQGGRLVRCPDCTNWFVRDRRNKEYCSAACANRATSRRWYAKKVRRRPRGPRRKE